MQRLFWEAAVAVDPFAAGENTVMRFGHVGEIGDLFRAAGLTEVATGSLEVQAAYSDLDDFWNPFVEWAGPVGQFCRSLDRDRRAAIREQLRMRVGAPGGSFTLPARAWYATGRV
jgi:hypothetical protein